MSFSSNVRGKPFASTTMMKLTPSHCTFLRFFSSLLHPLSPRGKLVYLGLEGLRATNRLIEAAAKFDEKTVLRDKIVRLATTRDHVTTLRETSLALPQLTTWLSPTDDVTLKSYDILGALVLHSGCKVVYMPSYLRGLWQACESAGSGQKKWVQDDTCSNANFDWRERLAEFDCVILAAGAALFQTSIVYQRDFPVQLVRGQSIELTLPEDVDFPNALLCGKYVSPLPQQNRVLIGATHEYKEVPLSPGQVEAELKDRSYDFASTIWNHGMIDRITSGYRAQTNRGKNGRLPIIGRYDTAIHHNAWIFTGLSSRGLLYHGIFGDKLSDLVLGGNNEEESSDLDWWRTSR
jgi:glycine/D-amino acid oxidase-like deaminating enzyme